MATQSKEEIYFAVCNSILKMEVSKGHLKWTLSDISRDSNVTRSLIYYYFGKEKHVILTEAYKFILANFFNIERTKSMGIRDRLKQVLGDMKNMPYLLVLYYLEKNKDSEFGRTIKEAERMLLIAMKREFPNSNDDEILEIYLKELGAVLYQLPPSQVEKMFTAYI